MGRGSLYKAGDILRNLKIRISDPRKKSAPEKLSQILLWLETYENDHFRTSERERERVELQGHLLFLKNVPLFSRITL